MIQHKQLLVREGTMAQMLGISKAYLIKLRYARKVPCLKIGRAVRYDPHEVVIALEKFAVREVV